MTSNPQTPASTLLHYLVHDATKIIYYCEEVPEDRHDLIYIDSSDNPNPKAAAAFLMRNGKVKSGFKLRNLDEESS